MLFQQEGKPLDTDSVDVYKRIPKIATKMHFALECRVERILSYELTNLTPANFYFDLRVGESYNAYNVMRNVNFRIKLSLNNPLPNAKRIAGTRCLNIRGFTQNSNIFH